MGKWIAVAGSLVLGCVVLARVSRCETVGDCIAMEFVTGGCPQCLQMDQCATQALARGWVVRRVDVQQDPFTAKRWSIHSTPTTLLIREGREVDRILGPVRYEELQGRMLAASTEASLREVAMTSAPPPQNAPEPPAIATREPATQSANQPAEKWVAASTPRARPQDCTVRIRIDEPDQQAVGSGTIIDSVQGEALVITCGHLFRGLSPQAQITVETFDSQTLQAFPAELIDFEAGERDIGLIAFRPDRAVPCANLLQRGRPLREGEPVFSLGCDQGRDPSRRDSTISKLNRYLGPPNVEVAGKPVQGRSGGGLFSQDGALIGVCYAADDEHDEGLYSAPDVLYQQIAKLGLHRLYERQEPASYSMVQVPPTSPAPPSRAITIIVGEGTGERRHFQIQDPSPALLQALEREGYAALR